MISVDFAAAWAVRSFVTMKDHPTIETVMQGFTLHTDQGSLGYCAVTLVRAGGRNILVDASHVGRRQFFLRKLAEKGLAPNDIDTVFLTHGHWDHMLNADLFPNATFLIHPLEREYLREPHANDWATPRYASLILETHRLQEVREGDEIGEGLRVIDVPGHSRGSMALLVDTQDGLAAIAGDALPSAWSVVTGLPRLVFWDETQAKASVAKLLAAAKLFYPGHDRPFRMRDGRVEYSENAAINFRGIQDVGAESGPEFYYRLVPSTETQVYLPPTAT